jgi:hypothetical protein
MEWVSYVIQQVVDGGLVGGMVLGDESDKSEHGLV